MNRPPQQSNVLGPMLDVPSEGLRGENRSFVKRVFFLFSLQLSSAASFVLMDTQRYHLVTEVPYRR